jgi:hypothetical protein
MPSFKHAEINGRSVLIPNDPPAAPENPPLTALNKSYRDADTERHDEIASTIKAASGAMKDVMLNRAGRRVQKNLRPNARG